MTGIYLHLTQCTQEGVKEGQACITFSTRFRYDVSGALVDTHRRKRFAQSKEVRFLSSAKFGVSKFYPVVYGKCMYAFRVLHDKIMAVL